MKILYESKQINEGPGAGYTVSGTLANVQINSVKNIKQSGVDTYGVYYDVELDATANFENVAAYSYGYGGEIPTTPVVIHKARVVGEEGIEPTIDDIKDIIEGTTIEASLGGGWTHSTFDGFIDVDYKSISNNNDLDNILCEFTDKAAVEYLDKAVTGDNIDTLYEVVKDGSAEDAFESEEEAIEYAKKYGYDEVRICYQTQLWPEDVDVETGDTVWTNDDMDESLDGNKTIEDMFKEVGGQDLVVFDAKGHFTKEANNIYNKVAAKFGEDELDALCNQEGCFNESLNESFDEEDRIQALANYLGINPEEISNIYDNEFETPEGDYLVVDEYEARELAEDDIRNLFDDLGLDSFTSMFRDWIIMNALDNDWYEEAIKESYEYYVEDIEDEASSMGYDNRLIEELHDHQILSDDDFEEDEDGEPDFRNLKDYVDVDSAKEEYVDLLVENAGNPVDYCGDEFGWDWVTQMATQNNLIDMDEVVEQAIYEDGIAHFISRYDGEEHDLGNGLYAYRTN